MNQKFAAIALCAALAAFGGAGSYAIAPAASITAQAVETFGAFQYEVKEDDSGNQFAVISGYDKSEKKVSIPAQIEGIPVKWIGNNAFKDAAMIESVTLPDSVNIICDFAFQNCTSLKTVKWPDDLLIVGEFAFQNCSSLTDAVLPEGTQQLRNYAFDHCVNLQKVKMPMGEQTRGMECYIGNCVFRDCTHLTSVELHEGLQWIGSSAFEGCSSLPVLSVPDGVQKLNVDLCYHCTSLQKVYIGNGPTEMPAYAFSGCTSLKELHVPVSIVEFDIHGSSDHGDAFQGVELQDLYYAGSPSQWNAIRFEYARNWFVNTQFHYGAENPPAWAIPEKTGGLSKPVLGLICALGGALGASAIWLAILLVYKNQRKKSAAGNNGKERPSCIPQRNYPKASSSNTNASSSAAMPCRRRGSGAPRISGRWACTTPGSC